MKNREINNLDKVWETPEITVLSINKETGYNSGGEQMDDNYVNS